MPECKQRVLLLSHTPDAQAQIALGARLCYAGGNVDKLMEKVSRQDQQAFLEKLMSMGHESVLEHVSFTFLIEGVSRVLLAQLTRHRIASFSVQSQRYVSYKDGFGYIRRQMEQINEWYQAWRERLGGGTSANEDARFVLPGACETRIMLTMNARELRHFFALRMCSRAQWEIRALAESMFALCYKEVPALFADAGPECLRRGCPEGAKSCGRQAEMRARREAFLRENQPSGLAEA